MSAVASHLKQLPLAASILFVGGLTAFGAIYWMSYQQRWAYVTSRNFRLLAVLAMQTEGAIADKAASSTSSSGVAGAGRSSPIVSFVQSSEGHPALGLERNRRKTAAPLDEILTPLFEPKIDQGAFDTVALATRTGAVLFAVGRREQEIQSMRLEALLSVDQSRIRPPLAVQTAPLRLFQQVTVEDAVVAAVPYKMFVEPCCTQVTPEHGQPVGGAVVIGLVATDAMRREAMAISPTLVVITTLLFALALLAWPFLNVALHGPRMRVTRWDALQLGFSGTVGLAIATILAFTFVQCARLEDDLEMQLARLAEALDEALADDIDQAAATLAAFERWLAACPTGHGKVGYTVAHQCAAARPVLAADADVSHYSEAHYSVAALIDSNGRQVRKAWPKREKPPLVDVKNREYFRTANRYSESAARVPQGHAGSTACTGPPCVVESVVSWTTGEPSAVLARPSGHPRLPVAALTAPMRSVIDPVLPPGFEFAVIDKTGHVVFHSDVQRNNYEELFLETDGNRQLRAFVTSGVNGSLRTDYWGRPYLAHVRHARMHDWCIVTLFDLRDLRGLMLEWTLVSLLLLVAYTVLWAAVVQIALTSGASWLWPDPFRRRRYAALSVIFLILLTGFCAAMVTASVDRSTMGVAGFLLPLAACLITWLVLRHRPAAEFSLARMESRCFYCVPGALLLAITGIVPGAAFVARSYDAHIEAYLKHRQLGLVKGVMEKSPREGLSAAGVPDGVAWWQGLLYDTELCQHGARSETSSAAVEHEEAKLTGLVTGARQACAHRVARVADAHSGGRDGGATMPGAPPRVRPVPRRDSAHDHAVGRDPFRLLEAYLPYFSETSVAIRELVHDRADDGSWTSAREGRLLWLTVPPHGTDRVLAVTATTVLPSLVVAAPRPPGSAALQAGVLAGILIALLAVAYGIVRFIARFVFLEQVTVPQWALGRLAIREGSTVILACDTAAMARQVRGAAELRLGPLAASPDPDRALAQALTALTDQRPSTAPILVSDLNLDEPLSACAVRARLLCALARSGGHAVIALSGRPWRELVEAVRNAGLPEDDAIAALEQTCDVTLLDWRAYPDATAGPLVLSVARGWRWWWHRRPTGLSGAPRAIRSSMKSSRVEALLHAEAGVHVRLHPVGQHIRRLDAFRAGRLGREEMLEEIDEAAEGIYTELWHECSDEEKLELRHIAQSGLANTGNQHAVRQLIARRLVTKDPNLRLMNRTFRRFVLSSRRLGHIAQVDVARIESTLTPSVWDRFRVPFGLAVLAVGAFLFITQRETFNTTVGALVGVSTALPHIIKAITFIVQKDSPVVTISSNV